MSVFTPVDLKVVSATQPYFVYNRLPLLAQPRVYQLYTVPAGFNFLVRQIITQWDSRVVGGGGIGTDPALSCEIYNNSASRARQTSPIPFHLFSSPGCGDCIAVPFALPPLGFSFTVVQRRSARIMNLAFPYGDTVRIEITGQSANIAIVPPYNFLDIVLEGYLVAETALAMWGNTEVNSGDN